MYSEWLSISESIHIVIHQSQSPVFGSKQANGLMSTSQWHIHNCLTQTQGAGNSKLYNSSLHGFRTSRVRLLPLSFRVLVPWSPTGQAQLDPALGGIISSDKPISRCSASSRFRSCLLFRIQRCKIRQDRTCIDGWGAYRKAHIVTDIWNGGDKRLRFFDQSRSSRIDPAWKCWFGKACAISLVTRNWFFLHEAFEEKVALWRRSRTTSICNLNSCQRRNTTSCCSNIFSICFHFFFISFAMYSVSSLKVFINHGYFHLRLLTPCNEMPKWLF